MAMMNDIVNNYLFDENEGDIPETVNDYLEDFQKNPAVKVAQIVSASGFLGNATGLLDTTTDLFTETSNVFRSEEPITNAITESPNMTLLFLIDLINFIVIPGFSSEEDVNIQKALKRLTNKRVKGAGKAISNIIEDFNN